jgi:hypothetical protein
MGAHHRIRRARCQGDLRPQDGHHRRRPARPAEDLRHHQGPASLDETLDLISQRYAVLWKDCSLVGLPAGAEVIGGPVFFEPAALRRLGLALTWGGFLLEAALACAFLLSRLAPLHRSRDMLLMNFAVVTYAAAPVARFGWLLAAMGCAQQCDPDRVGLRAGCLAVFALVLAYSETPLVPLLLRSWFRARRLVTC